MLFRITLFTTIVFTLFLSACSRPALVAATEGPIDLGIHTDNNRVSFNIKLVNSSKAPISIDSITTSVSYLSPAIAIVEKVQPGDTLEIPMLLFTQSAVGDIIAQVKIYNSDSKKPIEKLVKATIKATPVDISEICTVNFGPLLIDRNLVTMVELFVGTPKSDSILIYNPTDRAINIILPREYGNATATMNSSVINPKKADYIIVTANYNKESAIGERIFHSFRFAFDRDLSTNAYIYLQGELSEDFSRLSHEELLNAPKADVETRTYEFGTINEGEEVSHSFQLTNKGKRVLKIRSASSSCDCTLLKLKVDSLMPGESMPLTLYFNSKGKYGAQQRQIKLKTNDPENSLIELWLTGNVK